MRILARSRRDRPFVLLEKSLSSSLGSFSCARALSAMRGISRRKSGTNLGHRRKNMRRSIFFLLSPAPFVPVRPLNQHVLVHFLLAFPRPRWIRFPSDNCYYRPRANWTSLLSRIDGTDRSSSDRSEKMAGSFMKTGRSMELACYSSLPHDRHSRLFQCWADRVSRQTRRTEPASPSNLMA